MLAKCGEDSGCVDMTHLPVSRGQTASGVPYERGIGADVRRGEGSGYGRLFVQVNTSIMTSQHKQ